MVIIYEGLNVHFKLLKNRLINLKTALILKEQAFLKINSN